MGAEADHLNVLPTSLDQRRVMARSLAYLWAAGGTMLVLSVLLPHGARENGPALLVEAGLAYAMVGVLLGVRGLRTFAFELITALGTAFISAAVVLSRSTASAYAFFLVWVTVYAFYFLPWMRAGCQLLAVAALYGAALLVTPSGSDTLVVRFVIVCGTLLVTAGFVGLLKGRIDRLLMVLADAARRDFLTGLLNRRGFEEAFEGELERVERRGGPLSVLVADLDHFKQVNDQFGHDVGDDALRLVARALGTDRRRIDTVARRGGEEFALLLPDTDPRGASVVGERLCGAVRASTGKGLPPLTISIGIATFPADGRDAETLMRAADEALYAAKRLGRDRAVLHSPDLGMILAHGEEHRADQASMGLATALALADALDLRDQGAAQHSRAVGTFAELAARELGLHAERVERVRIAALLHDIGNIGIADSILHKAGPLDPHEWEQMRKHPEIGARLLTGPDVGDIRSWVLAHHERPDGHGYPHGIKAPAIPLEASILAGADAVQSMTTDRSYRPALGVAVACEELRRGSGTQFDPRVAEALILVLERVPPVAATLRV